MKKSVAVEQLFYWISVLTMLCGALLWLTTIDTKATASVQGVTEVRVQVQQDQKQFEDIRARLIRIEDKLDRD